MRVISRADGGDAIAAAAYRCGGRLTRKRDGIVHDYPRRDVVHSMIILPSGVTAAWACDRQALWNEAEAAERRRDARVAREFEIALPAELSPAQRRAAAQDFAHWLAEHYGVAVDLAIHTPRDGGDPRNHHAHLLVTTREVLVDGFGAKSHMEQSTKSLRALGLRTTQEQLILIRQQWEKIANSWLARGHQHVRVDRRSHKERRLEVTSTRHVGANATEIQRRGGTAVRTRSSALSAKRNLETILGNAAPILHLARSSHARLGPRATVQVLSRFVGDDRRALRAAFVAVRAVADGEATQVVNALNAVAKRRRQVTASGDVTTLAEFDRQVAVYKRTLRHRIEHDAVFKDALRRTHLRLRPASEWNATKPIGVIRDVVDVPPPGPLF